MARQVPVPPAAIRHLPFLHRQMLQKLREDEPQAEQPLAELDNLGHTDWVRCDSPIPGPRGPVPGGPCCG